MGLLSSLFGGGKPNEDQQAKQEKKNFEILKYDGIRARNMRQLPYAIKCFEQAIALNDEPETLQLLANAYIEAGRTDDARITLDRLVDKTPDNIQALLALASICYMQEDYESMDNACQKAIKLDETSAPAYYLAAKAARGMKNDLQAIVMLTKAIMQNEEYKEAYLLRAEVLWDMRQAKDAMSDLDKVLSVSPEEEDALLLKGKIHAALGQVEEAQSCFNQVLEVNPFNEKAYLLKGEMLMEQKEFDQAIEFYTEATELMPQNAVLYQERGRIRLLKGDKEGSIEDMKKAIELNPDNEKLITGNYDNFKQNSAPGIY